MTFPVYRKYINLQSYFIIHSETSWTEYKRLGKKFFRHDFKAVQFPEKLFVKDLIELNGEFSISSAEEIAGLPT